MGDHLEILAVLFEILFLGVRCLTCVGFFTAVQYIFLGNCAKAAWIHAARCYSVLLGDLDS